jgi:glycosyltransferase involved in cell wall biosynthesis
MFGIDAWGNWLDIKLADAIVVQSEFQKRMLKQNFGKDSTVIKMPFPLTPRGVPEKSEPPVVLWVGAMAEVKQPELLVKLAEAIPEAKFQMVGGPSANRELYDQIGASASTISNLELAGFVPFDKVNDYFSRASILVNTSMFEGFPYAFIQAWMCYTPVVSLNSDPDEIICQHRLGFHSRAFPQLTQDVRRLLADEPLRQEMGENGRQYVEKNHDIDRIVTEHIEVISRLGEYRGLK